jgi:hypothetical protein
VQAVEPPRSRPLLPQPPVAGRGAAISRGMTHY